MNRINGIKSSMIDEGKNEILVPGPMHQVSVCLEGENNIVEIQKDVQITGILEINIRGNFHHILIKSGNKFVGNNRINFSFEKMNLFIDENNSFNCVNIVGFGRSNITIGRDSTFAANTLIYAHVYSKINIGDDNMFSFDTVVQSGDGHSIFDIESGENINTNLNKMENGHLFEIVTENHVWVGRRAFILGGKTFIGRGSIIGANSLVKKQIPNNVIAAGSPAKVVRKNVAWTRKSLSNNVSECGEYIEMTQDIYPIKMMDMKIKENVTKVSER